MAVKSSGAPSAEPDVRLRRPGPPPRCQRVRPGMALLEVRGLREEACPTSVGSLVAPRSHPLGGEDTSAWRERIEHREDDNR
jgi:hypothetical protein